MQNVANGQQVTVVNACLFQLEDRCACFFDFWKRRVAARSFVFETVFAAAVSGGRWDGQRLRFESLRPYANNDFFVIMLGLQTGAGCVCLFLPCLQFLRFLIPMPGAGYLFVPSSVTL